MSSTMLKGISLSVLASVLFGSMYYYTTLLTPLDGEQIFGWRMVLTLPIMSLFLIWTADWSLVQQVAGRLRKEWKLWLALPLSSMLLGIQLWLFLWAPLHGHALDVSLGYFMMPLVMVLIGRYYYKDRLSTWQKMATLLALAGVVHELFRVDGLSWATLLVCLGYPYYFVLRSQCKTDNLGGLWFDMALMLPVALYFAWNSGLSLQDMLHQHPALPAMVVLLGVLSAAALVSYIVASRLLPFSLFGLLGYVEPVLLVGVSFLIGETIEPNEWPTYIAIWLALVLLTVEGAIQFMKQRAEWRKTNPDPD
jgi:chloramphenicol-sensitive protein RarD